MSSIEIKNLTIKFNSQNNRITSLKDYFSSLFNKGEKIHSKNHLAINNISFNVNPGDRLGIVGRNGAGKSTLLKAICKIYEPSAGTIKIKGKVAPMLEIGAGFHPEFTGRENIYLNGAILGYTKAELRKIEQDVINFAELNDHIDTPVKYYSTGMYMRLAFSLSTSIHPDILVLDEIFNGGDFNFLTKAKKRMMSLIDNASIVIMVSHDHSLLESLCTRIIWMENGEIISDDIPEKVIKSFLSK